MINQADKLIVRRAVSREEISLIAPASKGANAEPRFPRKYWIEVAVLRTSGRTTSYTDVAILGEARGIKKQVIDNRILKAKTFSKGIAKVMVRNTAPNIMPASDTTNLPILNFL